MIATLEKLDEKAMRRPDFQGGEGITLSDGQVWYFPKPLLEFAPHHSDGAPTTAGVVTSLGDEFDRLIQEYDEACAVAQSNEPEPTARRPIDAMMGLACHMIRLNYDVDNATLSRILRWRPNDEVSNERWATIINVARGLDAPKPSAGGSDSP